MRNCISLVAIASVTWSLVSSVGAQAPARLIEIDRLGEDQAFALDLNNWGQVVGFLSEVADGTPSPLRPFVWYNGRTRLLPAPSDVSEARAINGFGRIVGSFWDADSKVYPLTWAQGRYTKLATDQQAIAVDVNNRGQIVGYNSSSRGVLWQNASSEPTDLGTIGGGFCEPTAINDHGLIVGMSATASNEIHAFVWEEGVMTDVGLPDHPDPAVEIVRTRLDAINEDGLAAGVAYAADGTGYPLLWNRTQGARVSPAPITTTVTLNSWGTVGVVTTQGELFLGSYGRPFRSRGSFPDVEDLYRIRINDVYQIAFSGRRGDRQIAFFGQLRP